MACASSLRAQWQHAEQLTDAYLRSLDAVVPLPRSLTFDQLKPWLIAAGVPVNKAMAALVEVWPTRTTSPSSPPSLREPIPLEYVDTFTGHHVRRAWTRERSST